MFFRESNYHIKPEYDTEENFKLLQTDVPNSIKKKILNQIALIPLGRDEKNPRCWRILAIYPDKFAADTALPIVQAGWKPYLHMLEGDPIRIVFEKTVVDTQ